MSVIIDIPFGNQPPLSCARAPFVTAMACLLENEVFWRRRRYGLEHRRKGLAATSKPWERTLT